MQKLTVLVALFIGACALDPDTSSTDPNTSGSDPDTSGGDPDTSGTVPETGSIDPQTISTSKPDVVRDDCDCPPPDQGPTCTTKQEGVVDLNSLPANTDHEDGRVSFCHATGSSSNPYILLTTDVSGCVNGHADHHPGGNDDIFATQGCDD